MSEYYGRVQGSRGEATRGGTKASGLHTSAETWNSRVIVELSESPYTKSGKVAMVSLCPKEGFSVVRLDLNADGIAECAEDIHVREALEGLERACTTVNLAVRIAQGWNPEIGEDHD